MDTTTNYGLKKPAYEDGADIETLNENADAIDTELKANADTIAAHTARTDNPHQITAEQVGALPDTTTALPNPSALTISQGYGGTTGTYNGSAAKSISIPHITLHTSAPGTVADGELWGVY